MNRLARYNDWPKEYYFGSVPKPTKLHVLPYRVYLKLLLAWNIIGVIFGIVLCALLALGVRF